MAVKFTYGTVGSGKSYDMMCGTLEDFRDGHTVATINLNLRLEHVHDSLKKLYGMSHYDANQAVGRHEAIFTETRFRELRAPVGGLIKLKADECHFWWPRQTYYKLSIEDVLAAAMSRKRRMDMHLISQLNGQINQDIAGLSSDNWLARPLKIEPFYSSLKLYTRVAKMFGAYGRPAAFFYVRVEDDLGKTRNRKDGSMDPDNKRMRFLHPLIARCYDTLEEVSSPILDRIRDEARFQYYIDILKGKVKPQGACPVCAGKRKSRLSTIFEYVEGKPQLMTRVYAPGDDLHDWLVSVVTDDCRECDGRGYIYPDNHPDFAIARQFADRVDALGRRARRVETNE